MPLTYNQNVPQGAQTIASTQQPILDNFQSINSAFNDNAPLRFTKYAMQDVNPVAAPVDPIGIFHMLNGVNTLLNKPVPYFRNSAGDFALIPDIKVSSVSSITNYGFQLGSIIINFGIGTSPAANSTTITLQIPYTSALSYTAIAGPNNGAALNEGTWSTQRLSASQIRIFRGFGISGVVALNYFTIGV